MHHLFDMQSWYQWQCQQAKNETLWCNNTLPLCPKPGIYRSRMELPETIDQDIKLWWLSHEGSMRPFRGRLNSENGLICSFQEDHWCWIITILLARLVYIHKTPVGNFSQGWWWLSWVHQITATAADQTNYANICSAPAQLYFDLETFGSFFCAGEFASGGKFLMSGKCKPGQNLISGAIKRLKEVAARYAGILSILFPIPYSTKIAFVSSYNICDHNFGCDVKCLVFHKMSGIPVLRTQISCIIPCMQSFPLKFKRKQRGGEVI